MKALSSVASITAHVALGAAVFLGTTKTGRSDPTPRRDSAIFFQTIAPTEGPVGWAPPGPGTFVSPDLRFIGVPNTLPQIGATTPSFSPVYSGAMSTPGTGQPGGASLVIEEHAEVLTGPLPTYPDLLRQAGIQGRVVLEAVVDTTGRVLSQSISVVSATNPGFVAPARRALEATLFRPARVGGTTVRMRVRIPYEFAIRNGTGRAR
jgi:TonB family protein